MKALLKPSWQAAVKQSKIEDDNSLKPLPKQVWLLSWVSFFADVSSEMIYPLLPLYVISVLGTSKMQLGAMEGGAVLIVAMMSAYAGIRSDRNGSHGGRIPWIRWGYGLPVLGKALIAISTTWPLIVGGRLLDRFGKGLRGAPRDALIASAVSKDQRGQAFGLHRAFDTAGALVGVLLSAFLLWWLTGAPQITNAIIESAVALETPAWVYRAIFAVGAVLGLASLALTFLVRESEATADVEIKSPVPDALIVEKQIEPNHRSGHRKLPASYWYVLGILVLFSLANSSDTFLLLRAQEMGFSPWMVVMAYAAYNLTYSALAYPAGALSDRIGRWRIIVVGWLIYAGVYTGFAILPVSQAWGVWPLMIVYGIYMALTEGTGKALIADHAPQDSRGMALGIFYGLTGLTTFVSSMLTGYLWDRFGATPAFLSGGIFALLACLAISVFRPALVSKRKLGI